MNNIEQKQCFFCTNNRNIIDYKDAELLKKFMSSNAKIYPRRKSGLCALHQRRVAIAVKRARFLALVPYTTR
ncbi:MAG: 30S ribosomal protein S18 [Candidatus Sungbacteria bacterium]|nr:30S ribosomal protein S18 [Candidatus Sungbacteria bacterium]